MCLVSITGLPVVAFFMFGKVILEIGNAVEFVEEVCTTKSAKSTVAASSLSMPVGAASVPPIVPPAELK